MITPDIGPDPTQKAVKIDSVIMQSLESKYYRQIHGAIKVDHASTVLDPKNTNSSI